MKAPKLDENEKAYVKLLPWSEKWYLEEMLEIYNQPREYGYNDEKVLAYLKAKTQIELVRRALVRE